MKKSLAATLLIALFPLTCLGQTWEVVGRDPDSTTSVDVSSIKVNGDIAQAWILMNYNQPQSADGASIFSSIKSKFLVNCAKGLTADADYVFYASRDAGGKIVFSAVNDTVFAAPESGSKSAVLMEFVCKQRPTSKSAGGG